MAIAVAAFALPIALPAGSWWRVREWLPLVRWRVVTAIAAALAIGGVLFAWRTWYYTGVFGVFHGTQREFLAVWKAGMTWQEAVPAMISSVMMVLTGQDPPRITLHASPLVAAGVISRCGARRHSRFSQRAVAGRRAVSGRAVGRARHARLGTRRTVLDSPLWVGERAVCLGSGGAVRTDTIGACKAGGRMTIPRRLAWATTASVILAAAHPLGAARHAHARGATTPPGSRSEAAGHRRRRTARDDPDEGRRASCHRHLSSEECGAGRCRSSSSRRPTTSISGTCATACRPTCRASSRRSRRATPTSARTSAATFSRKATTTSSARRSPTATRRSTI